MLGLFWGAVAAIVHTYVVFPVVVLARGRLRARPHDEAEVTPAVSIVIAAHNEAADIGAKLESLLGLDYPADRLELIVASDGSDDGTEEVVAGYAERGVRLVRLPRSGKASALNAGVAEAGGEVLVFTDANSRFEPGALRALVRPFADPGVGGVAGDQRYLAGDSSSGAGERRYWDLDRMLKQGESRAGHVISATGAIYAVRRRLFAPVVDGVTDDFATSTAVIARGYRLVFAPDAVAWEPVAASTEAEWSRKVRVMTRGLRAVALRRGLLRPDRHGFYAYQLLTHKVLRRLMALPLTAIAVSSPFLWRRGRLYRLAVAGQAAGYGLAAAGLLAPRSRVGRARPATLAGYFCMVNAAGATAAWNVVRGHRIDRWEPQRSTARPAASDEAVA